MEEVPLVVAEHREDGNMKQFISEQDRINIEKAIGKFENKTSGEIVAVVAPMSDNYYYIPTLYAALFSMLSPSLLLLLGFQLSVGTVSLIQVPVFVALVFLFRWRPIMFKLVPPNVRAQRVRRLALEQFYQQKLYQTEERCGILFFVSIAERQVEIIADKGINERVQADTWSNIIELFVSKVRTGQVADGFIKAIDECGKQLEQYFPATAKAKNQIPNHLVIL